MVDSPNHKYVIGISSFYHDSAACLVKGNNIIAAAQEERFTRKKHDSSFPINALKYCLNEGNISLDDVECVVFYDKPLLKFERLIETYLVFVPRGLHSFINAVTVWVREKIFLKKIIRTSLKSIDKDAGDRVKILFSEHHLSHAASAFYPSPFEKSAIITIDGVGEWATTSIGYGSGSGIEIIEEMHFPHSLGLLYSAFTYFLGFTVNSGEYKLMGLAPYGSPSSKDLEKYKKIIYTKLICSHEDGSLHIKQDMFRYATGLRMINDKTWENIFGFSVRKEDDDILQHHCDLALAIQQVTEEVVIKNGTTC